MDDTQEQDQYEERLKEVFNSFDASGSGSLSPEELADLCLSLQLDDATPALLHTLLQSQDRLAARVDFDQFKDALILVLSSTLEPRQEEQETVSKPESPEIKPKFVKGSKRYGRRSTPEFTEPIAGFSEVTDANTAAEEDPEDKYDSAVPRKREEYEAEGQMHLWNPDEPSTPRGAVQPRSPGLEERLRDACDELQIPWDGCAGYSELHALCEHLRLEPHLDVLQNLTSDGVMDVQEFVSRVLNPNKPPTPASSTPYRQLKRHHSTQPFDEGGRRTTTSSALTSTIGMRLFSTLDDGTGFTPVEYILDAWMDEGIENSTEILQALNFSLDGKLSLCDLTMALENELLLTKNGIHQAALASFKAEIRHLLESVDRELCEKEKIRSDLEKAEKLKTQLATEVDERHAAIEHTNNLNLRKLEQEHKEKLAAVRSELMTEMDQMQVQAGLQREELEAEVDKIREEESFLRDHLSISVKENRRLEMELLDSTEKLVEAQSQNTKLQTFLDNVMKEKLGDLDPGSADILLHEERIKELRRGYEAQYRVILQDRIDELQSELQEFHSLGRVNLTCHKPLSEELESKSPGMESDPGIGSEDVQPFSVSLEAEMMLEQLKERHLQEMGDLQNQLESKVSRLTEQWQTQRAQLDEQNNESLQVLLEEEMLRLVREQEEKEGNLRERWESERAQLEERQEEALLNRILQEKSQVQEKFEQREKRLREEWERQRLQLEEDYEGMLQERLKEEREKFETEKQEEEQRGQCLMAEERARLEESHREAMRELSGKHTAERDALHCMLDKLRDDIAQERREIEISFGQRIEEVESRFSGDQQSAAERFQADLLKLEQHYQSELKALSEKHVEQKSHWEAQVHEALENAGEQIRMMQEAVEQEKKTLHQEWTDELHDLESLHEKETEELVMTTRRLQSELDDFVSSAQSKEIALSRQLNDLHNRLQGSLETKDQHVAQLERKALEAELLLSQTVEDFKQEREELLSSQSELQAKYAELLSISEGQITERIELLTERDDLRMAIEELETLLRQAAVDFELERKELQEHASILEEKSENNREDDREGLLAERDVDGPSPNYFSILKAANNLRYPHLQISKLQLQSQRLEDEKVMLLEKNAQNISDIENLRQQLAELTKENESREVLATKEKNKVSGVQGWMMMMLMKMVVVAVDETLQAVNHQSARLKSDLRVSQQERDSLQHEVDVVHKKLQNVNDKNRVLEMALHSSGLQSKSKKLYREEMSRLVDQEQQLLRQENERLHADVLNAKADLAHCREKVRQLDASLVSLKQHKHIQASLVTALEQENALLKHELQAQKELAKVNRKHPTTFFWGGFSKHVDKVLRSSSMCVVCFRTAEQD
uniref:Ninein n=1 Tax=Gasterosteus aculeatus aculeatus TaxID=481459 RepID=A0AAQ4NS69_GASAC